MQNYERKTPQDLNCGITVYMKIMGGKWKPCIIDLIHRGCHRPSEMHRQLPEATPRVIDIQLRELEVYGIVCKELQPGFPLRSDYYLTPLGESLLPVISLIDKWGATNADHVQQVTANLNAYTE
ncbi:DNA-binding HxlR family transcriptional regulator [Chitinophaga dinghuensis]|uniref:DNA-binding HxlR family transcriptional regulator n=1 Tax=Chitinophaga dinghuensis TaxID=1539050 RepID=A0A327VZ62_9BACT|nr:helix-turn-helix domain-containing protein [Chitinophaga dinghuensis]RAJ80195.1 DNA-binding HxlR family transcriptional regulator [Chitinophaga dinghuensis]